MFFAFLFAVVGLFFRFGGYSLPLLRTASASQRGSVAPEHSILLSLLILFAIPAINGTGAAINSTATSLRLEESGSRAVRSNEYYRPLNNENTLGPGVEISNNWNNNNFNIGGGTESNVPGGIEKVRNKYIDGPAGPSPETGPFW